MQKVSKSSPESKSLLEKLREQPDDNGSVEYWKPTTEGEGIEGLIVTIARGNRYNSLQLHLEGVAQIVSAYPDSTLEKRILEQQPQVGDKIGILFLGEGVSEAGRTYKKWRVAVEPAKSKIDSIFGAKG